MNANRRSNRWFLPLALTTVAASATASEGDLDPTFSSDGIATLALSATYDQGRAVAIQPDGKIVVVGTADLGGYASIATVRYDAAGNLDPSFSDDGSDVLLVAFGSNEGWDVAIQPDGKIVVAGCGIDDVNLKGVLLRYNGDGTLDTSFGFGGVQFAHLGSGDGCWHAVAIQPDGKIVAAGYTDNQFSLAIARYNSNGSLDTGFSIDGFDVQNIGFGVEELWDLAMQPDGKVLAAGCVTFYGQENMVLMRYTSAGSFDTTFNTVGMVTENISGVDDCLHGVALQDDGRIVVAGSTNDRASAHVARYTSAGSLDTTFSGDGYDSQDVGPGLDDLWDVAVQADDKIVVTGFSAGVGKTRHLTMRYRPNGSLDTSFSAPDGIVTHNILTAQSGGLGMALQADGQIVVAGFAVIGTPLFATVRYDVPSILFTDGFESGDTSTWSADP